MITGFSMNKMIASFVLLLIIGHCIEYGHVWAAPQYSIRVHKDECTFSTEFIDSAECYTKNLNWTFSNETMIVQLKPNVKLYTFYVCIYIDP